ncbi:MAG: S8 family serine peptidase [Clostridia bacterium]|nr:S8 family serine peptidase [Clostridia bacterium]
MKNSKRLLAFIVALIMALALVPAVGAETERPETNAEREAKIAELASFTDSVAKITTVYDKDLEAKKDLGEFALARIIVKSGHELHDDKAIASASGYNDWHVFQYATPEEAEAALKQFKLMDEVEWAEPDEIMEAYATPGSSSFKSWGFGASHINMYAYNQWLYAEYGSNLSNLPQVIVAVIDTGADSDHPFLVDRLIPGWNFVNNTDNPEDGHSHGTHVCGTVVDGTFSNVKIMPIKVLSDQGSGSTLNVGLGMEYGSLHGADVENMSLGGGCDGGEEHHFMAEIVDEAFDRGTTVVVAAGNESQDAANCCPANIERLCTVASIGQSHSLSYFSNYGPLVDIAAPGESITSSVPGGDFGSKDGTSMASPHVAAVAAQIKTANPDMNADEVISVIKAHAKTISATNAGAGMAYLEADMYGLDPAVNAEGSCSHFVSSGNYAWTVDGNSAVSGNAGVNNSTSTMKTELTVGIEQTITFDYKVSSESGDFFRVKANGATVFEDSGEKDWTTETVQIPGHGSVQVTFEFTKNASGASGSDKAWVRNFKVESSLSSAANITGGTVPFVSEGQYPWIVNNEDNAAMSGNAGVNNSESVMTAHCVISKGMQLTFKYKVDSASGDNFIFKCDGSAVLTSGATDGYVDFEYILPTSGDHSFEFIFKKNASGASGADAAFVKGFFYYHTFESAANVDGGDLPFDNSLEDYPWFAMNDYVTSSNWGQASTSSYFTLTLDMHAGETLSFRYSVSSVSSYDYFRFYVDGTKKTEASGERNWTSYTFTATSDKTYTFKWAFEKGSWDLSSWYGVDDAAYVDDIDYSGDYNPGILGDVNSDGVVDSEDALLMLRYSLGILGADALDLSVADVNGDGAYDSADALIILRWSLGIGV